MEHKNNPTLLSKLGAAICSYLHIRLIMFAIAICVIVLTLFLAVNTPVTYTEITDIAEYGNFSGTLSDHFTAEYIGSFFPDNLDGTFSDVKYVYKAENLDSYGFEAYLEFVISDSDDFNQFISQIPEQQWSVFFFDDSFMECNLDNALDIYVDDTDNSGQYHQILQAKIRKILYSAENHTIIFVAMGVYDGGGVDTEFFCTFFNRFMIDPIEYEQMADTPFGNPYEIS